MDSFDFGPAPGAFTVGGTGAQGQPDRFSSFSEWLAYMGAGGFGMGPYGYPLAYGISPAGQQNHLLNQQWGWSGMGNHPWGWGAGQTTGRNHRHKESR